MKFKIGDFVFLKTDIDQNKRLVISITLLPNNLYLYCLAFGGSTSTHYDFEISSQVNHAAKLNLNDN